MTVGERIKQAREAKGWTVEQLLSACPAASSSTSFGKLERVPDDNVWSLRLRPVHLAVSIATALNVSLDWLLTGKEPGDVEHELRCEMQRLTNENAILKIEVEKWRKKAQKW